MISFWTDVVFAKDVCRNTYRIDAHRFFKHAHIDFALRLICQISKHITYHIKLEFSLFHTQTYYECVSCQGSKTLTANRFVLQL